MQNVALAQFRPARDRHTAYQLWGVCTLPETEDPSSYLWHAPHRIARYPYTGYSVATSDRQTR